MRFLHSLWSVEMTEVEQKKSVKIRVIRGLYKKMLYLCKKLGFL